MYLLAAVFNATDDSVLLWSRATHSKQIIQEVTHCLNPDCCMCKRVFVLKITKDLYIVVVMIFCVKKSYKKKKI